MNIQYIECQNCSTIHYLITEEEAKTIQGSGILLDDFSDRNLECCFSCGSNNKFSLISKEEAMVELTNDTIPPILIKNEKLIALQKN
jgi:uncharacterized Zn finger protein